MSNNDTTDTNGKKKKSSTSLDNGPKGLNGKKPKKQKLLEVLPSPLDDAIMSIASQEKLRSEYISATPYPHAVLGPLCIPERMRLVHEEVTNNLKADFKETDLFKVFQTGELGNVTAQDGVHMPHLISLREAIYAENFRELVSKITGCDDLTDRVDISVNAYAEGCHLLCHDDVIGTRRVSFIIYLPSPDEKWLVEDGGALELYPLDPSSVVDRGPDHGGRQGIPQPLPSVSILPLFNTMAMFAVQPGRSYHSVQEVFASDKPRLSISGWFHGPCPPKGSDAASLNQILTKGDDQRSFHPFHKMNNDNNNNSSGIVGGEEEENDIQFAKDLLYLSAFINPVYLTAASMDQINAQFCKESSIQLQDFVRTELCGEVMEAAKKADKICHLGKHQPPTDYTVGVGKDIEGEGEGEVGEWICVGPPHKRRHLLFERNGNQSGKRKAGIGSHLGQIAHELFESLEFKRYLKRITALTPTGYRDEIRRFRPGLDYTVAHFGAMTAIPRLDATLCFVDDSGEGKCKDEKGDEKKGGEDDEEEEEEEEEVSEWDGGDVGGFECYIEADVQEDGSNEAAEVYRSDDPEKEETLLSVTAGCNVLSLVMRDQGIMRFVKYVGCAAPGSRYDITCEYEIEPIEDNDDDDDEDDDDDDDEDEE